MKFTLVSQDLGKLVTLHKTVEFLEGWQEKKKKQSLVNNFFHLIEQQKKTTAKTILEKIKEKSDNSQWRQGYINALEGMIIVRDAKIDQNIMINQIKTLEKENFSKVFIKHSYNELHSEFDRGFFSAWVDYMRILKRSIKST